MAALVSPLDEAYSVECRDSFESDPLDTGGDGSVGQNWGSDQTEFDDFSHWNPMLGSERLD